MVDPKDVEPRSPRNFAARLNNPDATRARDAGKRPQLSGSRGAEFPSLAAFAPHRFGRFSMIQASISKDTDARLFESIVRRRLRADTYSQSTNFIPGCPKIKNDHYAPIELGNTVQTEAVYKR
jgi:hypothetical protein